jgi:hypothetical protein
MTIAGLGVSSTPLDGCEVLSDAGWRFDDFVNVEMRKVLVSPNWRHG